jgi:hypothetical protein
MPNKNIVKNQNLIDFVTQHYGEMDKVIDFLALNTLEYDEFGDKDRYAVDVVDNEVINYYVNAREGIVSGLDTSGYTNLYADVTYYYPTTGTPTSIILPDPNIIGEYDTTAEFEVWGDLLPDQYGFYGYGTAVAEDGAFVYTNGSAITFGIVYTDVLDKELTIGTYDLTFTINGDENITGQTYIGGFVALADNGDAFYYSASSGSTTYVQTLELFDGEQGNINNEIILWYASIPTGATMSLEYLKLYKT